MADTIQAATRLLTEINSEQESSSDASMSSVRNVPSMAESASSGAHDLANRLLSELSQSNNVQQVALGGGSGLLCGYVGGKIGRAAVAAVGGAILVLTAAQHRGLVTINWGQLQRTSEAVVQDAERSAPDLTFRVFAVYFASGPRYCFVAHMVICFADKRVLQPKPSCGW